MGSSCTLASGGSRHATTCLHATPAISQAAAKVSVANRGSSDAKWEEGRSAVESWPPLSGEMHSIIADASNACDIDTIVVLGLVWGYKYSTGQTDHRFPGGANSP